MEFRLSNSRKKNRIYNIIISTIYCFKELSIWKKKKQEKFYLQLQSFTYIFLSKHIKNKPYYWRWVADCLRNDVVPSPSLLADAELPSTPSLDQLRLYATIHVWKNENWIRNRTPISFETFFLYLFHIYLHRWLCRIYLDGNIKIFQTFLLNISSLELKFFIWFKHFGGPWDFIKDFSTVEERKNKNIFEDFAFN